MTDVPTLSDQDRAEIEASIAQNRKERLEYIDFKVRWMREHGQIVPPSKP